MSSGAAAAVLLAIAFLSPAQTLRYPNATRGPVIDTYHGVKTADPYRWLEDPDSAPSREWINQENALTESYFASVSNLPAIKERLADLWSPTNYPPPDSAGIVKKRERYFYLRRSGNQNQPVLYWKSSPDAAPRVLLDAGTLSQQGTAAISSWSVNPAGTLLAYGIARAGSDWEDIHFREVDTSHDLPDLLEWIKFSTPEWSAAGDGVYYGRFPKPAANDLLTAANYNEQLMFHKIGTQQAGDEVIYQRPDHKDWNFGARVTDDGAYLVINVSEGTKPENLIFYRDLKSNSKNVVELVSKFEANYQFLGNRGPVFYFQTTNKAPKARVVSIDTGRQNHLAEVVPESTDVLDQTELSGDTLFLIYQRDVASQVLVQSLRDRTQRAVPLAGKGHVNWAQRIHGNPQFFSFESFTQPETLYSFNLQNWSVARFEDSKLPFDPDRFETRQVFFTSKDGTRVPMFLVARKGFRPDPSTPCLLWGYGGFNISLGPEYYPLYLEWIELGGIVASANLRGGGEYGEAWHQAGMKLKKQNVFDDFIAAAEWLIANRYTSTPKLGIYGRSNGGLLIGAVLNQRPDLFGAAVAGVGVMDMLRFPKFTIGHAWTSDYGSPDDPAEFKAIRAYSPLHNIREGGSYPPTLILTSDHDDRVVPAHSFKYAATLQRAQAGPAPILIRIETSAGHGGGKPISKRIDEAAAIIAFLQKSLGAAPENQAATYLTPPAK